ncbi:MAG: hypothetical protein GWN18_01860 [Thermoplasmata archaeon]|nr:hypothetical protein [Thermoplasmata archaeon]NIT75710.1 hypothetical protein [Thermoplasmata archaeon]NIU47856.1 hypothetical protein [Thermoplasmata archaeon]NIW81333.1 hypothetical protein [Thermoplasmata archaeon]NIY02081.1 hypothetical protein [Thermoplasmata archaeon]
MLVIVMVAMLALCALVPLPASPQSSGIVGRTRTGCTCHNQTESLGVAPAIAGLPGSWEPGEEYVLELTYEGGPARGPGARAGFDLRASKGELLVEGGSLYERVDPGTGEATHTLEGANESAWSVVWRSPDEGEGDVTFVLVVNAVNGDGVQGPGDQWGRTQFVVPEGEPGGLGKASDFWIVVALAAMMAIAAVAWYATRGPRVERR